jgi:predicted AlkP superfamily phosphohydrolase/phosphomutase
MRKKVLLIGLDAGDRELIELWEKQGFLPNIAKMRSAGCSATLDTTAEVMHVTAWPSIFTGTQPDKHGLYHAYVMSQGVQAPTRPRPELCPVPFLWKLLNDAGKTCTVVDAFLSCPIKDFKGVQITDWGSWTWFGPQSILPEGLGEQIAQRFGPYPAEDHSKVGMTPPADPEGFRNRLIAAVAKKTEVVKWLMQQQDWDFFLTVFGECHAAGHYFWHFQDSSYATHPAQCSNTLRHALRDVYIALDSAIGELISAAGPTAQVCLVSGDGMGPNYSGSHMLTPLLEKMRLFNDPGTDSASGSNQVVAKQKVDIVSALRNLIPKSLRVIVSRTLLPRSVNEKLSLRWKTAGIAWDRTKAFVIENANEGFIRINLKGREPEGIVQAGEEYTRIRDSLCTLAEELVNPLNGKMAACRVYKPQEMYVNKCKSSMPDIVITWNLDAQLSRDLSAPACGAIHSEKGPHELIPYYTGNHKPNAFMIMSGGGIIPGSSISGASILDIAPTVLRFFELPVPAHMDGSILSELLE